MEPEAKFTPPYNIPWATFINTIERIAADPPTRVDRSYLGSQSGNVQTYLIAALRGFQLINEENRPTGVLDFADPEARKKKVAELLHTFYPTAVPLGETNSTSGELNEAFATAFPQIAGTSRVKAIRFFLSAMNYAGLPTAPLWGAVRTPRGASSKRSSRKATPKVTGDTPPTTPTPAPVTTDTMRVKYFDLLVEKAKGAEQVDGDLLDRIERLLGVPATAATTDPQPGAGN